MSHNMEGWIISREGFEDIKADGFKLSNVEPLPQAFVLFSCEYERTSDGVLAVQFSRALERPEMCIAKVYTEYFGGLGHQSAQVWKDSILIFDESDEDPDSYFRKSSPISTALQYLGVWRSKEGTDEFDALNLGNFRDYPSYDY